MKDLQQLLQNKTYSKLILASFISKLGSRIGVTALLFYLLKKFSEQPYWSTWIDLMYVLPLLVVFLFTGVVADQLDRRKVAYYAELICFLLSLGLLFALQENSILLLLSLLFIQNMANSFLAPAESALVQGIVSKEQYNTAIGVNNSIHSLFDLFGKGIGVFIFWKLGVKGAVVIDAISFLISSWLIYRCHIDVNVRKPNGEVSWNEWKWRNIIGKFKEGFTYVQKRNQLKKLLYGFAVFGIVNGSLGILPIFFLKYKLSPTNYEMFSAWQGVVIGTGLLIGSFVATVISKKFSSSQMIVGGLLLSGLSVVLIGFTASVPHFLFLNFFAEGFLPFVSVGISTLIYKQTESPYMGRVTSLISPLMTVGQSLMLLFILIVFPSVLSLQILFIITGLLILITALFYAFLFFNKNQIN